MSMTRQSLLKRRHLRVRQKISGTLERPRLSLRKSSRHLYAQLIDDRAGRTLLALTTNTKANRTEGKSFSNSAWAKKIGGELGRRAVEKGLGSVVFDRGGRAYHGVVKDFAEAAREAGLKF